MDSGLDLSWIIDPNAPRLSEINVVAVEALRLLGLQLLGIHLLSKKIDMGEDVYERWLASQSITFEESIRMAAHEFVKKPLSPSNRNDSNKRGPKEKVWAIMGRYYIKQAWESFGIEATTSSRRGSTARRGKYAEFYVAAVLLLQHSDWKSVQALRHSLTLKEFTMRLHQLALIENGDAKSSVLSHSAQDNLQFVNKTLTGRTKRPSVQN